MHDGMEQQTQRIYQDMALLALDLFARIIAMWIDAGPPFSALFTLWLSIMAARGLAFCVAFSRHATESMLWIPCSTPSPLSQMKVWWTVLFGWKVLLSDRHFLPWLSIYI